MSFKVTSGRQKESVIWQYFQYDKIADKSKCLVTVNNSPCGKLIAGGNSTNVKSHLESCHKAAFTEYREKEAKRKDTQSCVKATGAQLPQAAQSTITTFVRQCNSWPASSKEALMRDKALLELITHAGLPARIVANEGFRNFCKTLDPRYTVPGVKSLNGKMQQMYEEVQANVGCLIKSARMVSLAMDLWTKKGYTASFLGISAAFYSPCRERPLHLLLNLHMIPHPHTAELIVEYVMKTTDQWKIPREKILFIVTDNGSNMVKAVRIIAQSTNEATGDTSELNSHSSDDEETSMAEEVEDEDAETDNDEELAEIDAALAMTYRRLPCIAHSLQLVIRTLDRQASYSNTISKVRNIVRSVRVSSVATQSLLAKCGKTLVTDCPTRWNSTLVMLNRLLDCKLAVLEVFEEQGWDGMMNSDWAKAEDISRLLQPFADHTNTLQTDTMSLASVIPALVDIICHLTEIIEGQGSTLKVLAQSLLQNCKTRFAVLLDAECEGFDPLAAAACLVDPLFASTIMAPEMVLLLEPAKTLLVRLMGRPAYNRTIAVLAVAEDTKTAGPHQSEQSDVQQETALPPPLKRFKFLAKKLTALSSQGANADSTTPAYEAELNTYLSECQTGNITIYGLDFWHQRSAVYASLAPVALDLLSMPASEAYAERVFSVCGELSARKRNRLCKNMGRRVFLHMNRNL